MGAIGFTVTDGVVARGAGVLPVEPDAIVAVMGAVRVTVVVVVVADVPDPTAYAPANRAAHTTAVATSQVLGTRPAEG
jgi:hypothetical protein